MQVQDLVTIPRRPPLVLADIVLEYRARDALRLGWCHSSLATPREPL
jgi:hypothetical protein